MPKEISYVGKYTTFNQKEINYDFDRACQVIILKA
jgi:hypothetical protein